MAEKKKGSAEPKASKAAGDKGETKKAGSASQSKSKDAGGKKSSK